MSPWSEKKMMSVSSISPRRVSASMMRPICSSTNVTDP
jgi:hypothetical protein